MTLLPLLLLALAGGCRPARSTAERTILAFVTAVQAERLGELYCLMAGAADPGDDAAAAESRRALFEAWARGRYEEYRSGRDLGGVRLEGDGIVLTKAFALGKGTFYSPLSARYRDGTLVVDTLVRFAYGEIDISGFPPGSVFYVCGAPVGRIHAVTVGGPGESETLETLETLVVRWTFVSRAGIPACPQEWAIASVVPLPETATTSRVTWVF